MGKRREEKMRWDMMVVAINSRYRKAFCIPLCTYLYYIVVLLLLLLMFQEG